MKNIMLFVFIAIAVTAILAAVYLFSEPRKLAQIESKQQNIVQGMLAGQDVARTEYFELLAPQYLHLGDTQQAQRVYDKHNNISAVILTALTDRAYAGRIGLLVAINTNCSIASVEVLQSQETPGLGDQYKQSDGAWLKNFSGKDLDNSDWRMTKQGGDFDAWTGATVTPKAIVESLERVLQLCEAHHNALFSELEIVYLEQ